MLHIEGRSKDDSGAIGQPVEDERASHR
jgi:hypothetical protein